MRARPQRILLKLSGELLAGTAGHGIDENVLSGLAEEVAARAMANGLLIWPSTGCADGVDGDLLNIAPPFVVTEAEMDVIVSLLAHTLEELPSVEGAER